jgi:hypothetical protein
MRRYWIWHALKFAIFAAIFIAMVSYVVMLLWNWLAPAVFGGHVIGYWEAMGLLVLSKILFGGLHRHAGGPWRWRHRTMERWAEMTPEEREKFRQGIRAHCGWHRHAEAEPKS